MEELDIYFDERYGRIYELNGDGELNRFEISTENGSVIYNFLKRKICLDSENEYYDITTPYGYGGPIFLDYKGNRELQNLKEEFKESFSCYCKENRIVSEFIRFNPVVQNHEVMGEIVEVSYNRDTICIDIEKMEDHLDRKCRNKIKKALKNKVEIRILENTQENMKQFYKLYIEAMLNNGSSEYYYFSEEFFFNNMNILDENLKIFAAFYCDEIVSASLILHRGKYMHYYFSGNRCEYKNLGANNLLIYEATKWGMTQGKKKFHLGGGHLEREDSLYKFKSGFSKEGQLKFYIGKKIHDEEVYKKLVNLRQKDIEIKNYDYFPLYRE